jgi:hypothetical protein
MCLKVGKRLAVLGDWQRAAVHFKRALEAHEVVYGPQDKKTIYVSKLFSVGAFKPYIHAYRHMLAS